ncbi:NIPSNAP family protein [Sphingosinicella terrae]|uniref:NIPSNAP family protein n=1 Tax=Sphingosinicella terrae TaxID=2172047 RepID=UPI002549BE59|nr:NIPSNAP family protein [Sphingosinicella terrae]
MLGRRGFLLGAAAASLGPAMNRVAAQAPALSPDRRAIGVIELRQYTLFGGRRDALVALFESAFIEPQEAVGAAILGIFHDLDDPDRLVWLRGFADMAARRRALDTFYSGPVWREHRQAANATMVDSDNVLLLRPSRPAAFASAGREREGMYALRLYDLGHSSGEEFAAWFAASRRPQLEALGADIVATFVSESAPNDFPALPVRSDRVFAWLGRWSDAEAEAAFEARMTSISGWRDRLPATLLPALARKPERIRLQPTSRSALR